MLPDIRPPGCIALLSGAFQAATSTFRPLHSPPKGSAKKLSSQLVPLSKDVRSYRGPPVRALEDIFDDLQRPPKPTVSGRWHKDKAASDPMNEACDMVALPWLFRQALVVLNNLEVEDSPEYFKTNLKAGGIMDVVERYPWSGEIVEHSRRDKRRGKHFGRVVRDEQGSPCIVVTWEDPYGGDCSDCFRLSADGNTLEQVTEMKIRGSGRETKYTTVYRRVQ